MRGMRLVILGALCALTCVVVLPAQNGPDNGPQNGVEDDYFGTWERVQGKMRWEWNIDNDGYVFTYHREEAFRIGSRGTLELNDDGMLRVTAAEITEDGEQWQVIDLEPEDRSREYGLALSETRMWMSKPGYPQFSVEYSRFVPVDEDEQELPEQD